MANLPASTSRRFNPGDYKNSPPYFSGRFLSQLNLFTEPVYLALQNGLNFRENFNAQYFTQIIQAGATPASNAFSFKTSILGYPVECVKVSCNVASDPSIPLTAAVDFSWYFSSGIIYVTAVSGLTAGTIYKITLRVN